MANENVVIRLNVKSDTGAIAKTQAALRSLGKDVDRSGGLFGKTSNKIDLTKRSLTAFEKSATFASKAIGMTFKTALMNAGAQAVILGAGIATVNGLFRVGQVAAKAYQMAMSGLAGVFAVAASAAGVFAAAMRENAAALASFNYSSQKQFGPAINQARAALGGLERDANLAVLGTKALSAAFTAVSKHAEFTASSQRALKQMAGFAYASGDPDKALAAAGDFIGLLQKKQATIGQIQAAMKASMGDQMYKKVVKEAKAKNIKLNTKKQIEEAVMSGKLAELGGVQDMLETMNGTLIGQLKSYMGQAKAIFADFGQPLLAPVKDAFREIFSTLKFSFAKISGSFIQFTSNEGIPAIVKFVEKASDLVVNLTQKYLPMASNWFSKLAAPMSTIKTFFKETLPNTLRPYRESAKVITDMFGKIFSPYFGGNAQHLNNLIKDNKQELLNFADGVGLLLGNLNKLTHSIMNAFMRLLPIINPVINAIGRLVGQIAAVFDALSSLGGLGSKGGSGKGTNLMGSIGTAMMMAMMFRGNKAMGNPGTYTQGASNKGFMGRMFNRAMGLPGQVQQYNQGIYTNRNARVMAYQTGQLAFQPGYGAGPGYGPGGGGGGAGGRGRGGAGGGGGPAGVPATGPLSLSYLTRGGKQTFFRGKTHLQNPNTLASSKLITDETTGFAGIATLEGQKQRRLFSRLGYTPNQILAKQEQEKELLAKINTEGGGRFKTAKDAIAERDRLAAIASPTRRQSERLRTLDSYMGQARNLRASFKNINMEQQDIDKTTAASEQKLAQQIANPTGQSRFGKLLTRQATQGTTGFFNRRAEMHDAKRINFENKSRTATANARAAYAAAQAAGPGTPEYDRQMRKYARYNDDAKRFAYKSRVQGHLNQKLTGSYTDTRAGEVEKIKGYGTYGSFMDRIRNRREGYQDKFTKFSERAVSRREAFQDSQRSAEDYRQRGAGFRAGLMDKKAGVQKLLSNRANQKFTGLLGLGSQDRSTSSAYGKIAGKLFKSGSMKNMLPGGAGIMGARGEDGKYLTRRGRALGGQSMGANMATSIGMSMIAGHMGEEAQGSMALGASIATMFGPLAGIAVGFGGAALKAKTKKGGAAAGAIAGAAIGTMIPGVGTLVGAAIGAMIGMGMGAWNQRKEQKKNARAVADSIARGYAQQATRLAFEKYSDFRVVSAGYRTVKATGTTRADNAMRSFDRFSNQAEHFAGMNKTQKLAYLDKQVATGQITREQATDASKALDNYTNQLTKQAAIYDKLSPIIKENYNKKLTDMMRLTGKSAAEIEGLADAMGVSLLDPTQNSIDALKSLGFFIEKTVTQLNQGITNVLMDAAKNLDNFGKSKAAPMVANELIQNFGNLARSGGLGQSDVVKFIQDLAPNIDAMNPNDKAGAFTNMLQGLGVGADGKVSASAEIFKSGNALSGGFSAISQAGAGVIQQFVGESQSGIAQQTYDQMQVQAMALGFQLPETLLAKMKTMNPYDLANLTSKFNANPQAFFGGAANYIKSAETASGTTRNSLVTSAKNLMVGKINSLSGTNTMISASDIGSTSQLTSTGNEKVLDLLSDEEKTVLTDLAKQWSDTATAMSKGDAPSWFNKDPVWWTNPPGWYSGPSDTPSPKSWQASVPKISIPQSRITPSGTVGNTLLNANDGYNGDTTSSRLAQTMSRHAQINAGISGKRAITSAFRTTNLGSMNSDHVTGRAYDLVGQNLGAYSVAVRKSGGFAEFHGGQANRHLHVVPGPGAIGDRPAASSMGSMGGGGGSSNISYNITVNGSTHSPEQIANVVMDKIKRAERTMNERR